MDIILQRLLIGFVINLIFGTIAFMREMVDDTGFFAGVVLFTLVYVFLDWPAYAVIVTFFILTGIGISIENRDKADKGEFELYTAKRPLGRVLGRSLAGAIFAGLFFLTDRPEFKLAFVASYAASGFDTLSTKLGKLLSKKAVLITNFKTVQRGMPGGISWQGTLIGMLVALIVCVIGFVGGLIYINQIFIAFLGAFAGSTLDSFLNAVSYQKRRIPNEFINFFGSMSAGIICVLIEWFFIIIFGIRK